MSRAVVVMAKHPQPGSAKTRLVPPLTPETAAELYECFLLDALDHARKTAAATPLVAVWPPDAAAYFTGIAPDIGQVAQKGESLDQRLDHVLRVCLASGFDYVVAINSDSPTLPDSIVTEGFTRLTYDTVDVVLGPADDGGYYLIGCKHPYTDVVRGVEMSTPRVLEDTLARARRSGVRVSLLDSWYDVDDPIDLCRLELELAQTRIGGLHTRRFLAARVSPER